MRILQDNEIRGYSRGRNVDACRCKTNRHSTISDSANRTLTRHSWRNPSLLREFRWCMLSLRRIKIRHEPSQGKVSPTRRFAYNVGLQHSFGLLELDYRLLFCLRLNAIYSVERYYRYTTDNSLPVRQYACYQTTKYLTTYWMAQMCRQV